MSPSTTTPKATTTAIAVSADDTTAKTTSGTASVVSSSSAIRAPSADAKRKQETSAAELLPTGWTRVQRKSRRTTTATSPDLTAISSEDCCNDPSGCQRRNQQLAQFAEDDDDNDASKDIQSSSKSSPLRHRIVVGKAVFCLPDDDSDWFQGYLFSETNGGTCWGLLCQVQEDIDACLQCDDYRELSMHVTEFDAWNAQKPQPRKQVLTNIVWTGADMMRFVTRSSAEVTNGSRCDMQADTIWTGKDAVARVETMFASLLRNLRQEGNRMLSVHDLMPNVAVVSGTMKLWLPPHQSEHS